MKYLLVIAVVAIAYAIWRNNREAERAERAQNFKAKNPQPAGQPQDMVRCPVCAVHLPRTDALAGPDGQLYCSSEHRLQSRG